MKSFFAFLLLMAIAVVGNAQTKDFGFLPAQKMFYNLENGVFTVYGESLKDKKFSLGDGKSFKVRDLKIVKTNLLVVVTDNFSGYCESYSLKSFKRNFRVVCDDRNKIDVSMDSNFFVAAGRQSGDLRSCFENEPTLKVFKTADGRESRTIKSVCGAFVFGAHNKFYSFRLNEKNKELSLLEIDILNGQETEIYSDFNSDTLRVDFIRRPQLSRDGQLISFNISGGSFPGFHIFDLDKKTRTLVPQATGEFISNLGFYSSTAGYVNTNELYDGSLKLLDWDTVFSLGCNARTYCPISFQSMNNEVFYAQGGHNSNTQVIAKYDQEKKLVLRAILYAGLERTSAHNATKIDGKNNLYYLSTDKVMVLDTNSMESKIFLDKISSENSSVHTSEDQSVVFVWNKKESKFSLYDANSSKLISETSILEGAVTCGNLSWHSVLTVKVSPENKKALIKCGAGNAVGVVSF